MLALLTTLTPGFASNPTSACVPTEPVTNFEKYVKSLGDSAKEVIAHVPPGASGVGNCYERIPGEGRSEICTVSDSVSQGGGVCNLVAQGYLHAVPNADFAIHNAGSCETDLATGDFSVEEAYDLLPYSNTLVTLQMTAAQIKVVLEEAITHTIITTEKTTGAYPYAAGLRYNVNYNNAEGNRIVGLEINSRFAAGWTSVENSELSTEMYTVVTHSYLAAGNDGYSEFGVASSLATQTDTFFEYADSFIKFARAQAGDLVDDVAKYSTKTIQGQYEPGMPLSPESVDARALL